MQDLIETVKAGVILIFFIPELYRLLHALKTSSDADTSINKHSLQASGPVSSTSIRNQPFCLERVSHMMFPSNIKLDRRQQKDILDMLCWYFHFDEIWFRDSW